MFISVKKLFQIIFVLGFVFTPIISSAKVIVKEKISYYNISGKTGIELHKSMRKNASRQINIEHTLAATVPKMRVKNVKADVVGRNCVIKSADVYLTITYILPRWTGQKKAKKTVVNSWNKFNKLLVRHEKKHGKITIDAVNSFYKELRRLKGKVSKKCEGFGRTAERRFKRIGKTMAARQRAFDRREGYGLSAVRRAEKKLVYAR